MDHPASESISTARVTVAMLIGSAGVLVLGVQPILLGSLVAEGRVSEAGIGPLVTVELLAMAVGSIVGTRWLSRANSYAITIVGGLLLAAACGALLGVAGQGPLLVGRGVAGFAEGLLLSLALVMITRSARPARLSAIFLVLQTGIQLAVAAAIPLMSISVSRADTALIALAVGGLVAIAIAAFAPPRLRLAETRAQTNDGMTRSSIAGLIAAALYLGGVVAAWSHLGLWLAQSGFADTEGSVVAVGLGAQILGGVAAATLAGKLPDRRVVEAAALAQTTIVIAMMTMRPSVTGVFGLTAAFGFLWLFALPSFTGYIVGLDRRAGLWIAAAQLGGSAIFPLAAAFPVSVYGVAGALAAAAAAFIAAAVTVALSPHSAPPVAANADVAWR